MIKHEDLNIDQEQPFKNCKLERIKYAHILTDMVSAYPEGFVLAINNEWGTGKTTFVKMWKQHLENNKFKTLYFNAWENDFEKDVLIALISELEGLANSKTKEIFKTVLQKAAPLAKGLVLGLIKTQIEKHIGKDVVKDALNGVAEATAEELQNQIDSYQARKNGIKEFKKSLAKFVEKSADKKPVVFIIDELDRCRPSYAVETLEQIKHLFSVPGIVFVLSIDKEQLGNAIRGVYGSDKLNAEEYLRRFIDIEYQLPKPNTEAFCKYLFEYFDFAKFFNQKERIGIAELQHDYDNFLQFIIALFEGSSATLRKQEKLLAQARVILNTFKSNHYLLPDPFVLLIFLKMFHEKIYENIRSSIYNIQELIYAIEGVLPNFKSEDEIRRAIVAEIILINAYKLDNKQYNDEQSFEKINENKEYKLLIKTKYNEEIYLQLLAYFDNHYSRNKRLGVSYLINKIELTEEFQFN